MKHKIYFLMLIAFYAGGVNMSSAEEKAYFTAHANCQEETVRYLEAAKTRIAAAMPYITSQNIARALARAQARGVSVEVITGNTTPKQEPDMVPYLISKRVPVIRMRGARDMDLRYCIIDESILLAGSYVWTLAGTSNADAVFLVCDSAEVVKQYADEHSRLWKYQTVAVSTGAVSMPQAKEAIMTSDEYEEEFYTGHVLSRRFHREKCPYGRRIREENLVIFRSRDDAVLQGYTPCEHCKP